MQIGLNCIVAIDYTLTNNDGDVLDTSSGRAPLEYLHGAGNIIPGLEQALMGLEAGASLRVTVPPAEAYGEHDSEKIQIIPRTAFPPNIVPQEGMQLNARGPDGENFTLWVVRVEEEVVMVDSNHPLAGETLNFDVTIRSVRAATEEELGHGHSHGHGGHHH